MKTFKNLNFKKRDYETTNVVFCQSEKAPKGNWIECNEDEINCNQLWIESDNTGDYRYFGYL